MKIDEAIKILKNILNTKDRIDKIQDKEEREIEYSAYLEDMPFEAIETVLKNRKKYVDKDIIRAKIEKKINTIENETWYVCNGGEARSLCVEELEILLEELLEED